MKYLVIEIQTAADGTVANIVTSHDTRNAAESAYHGILAAAAISSVPSHAATILTSDGNALEWRCYEHPVEAEEEVTE